MTSREAERRVVRAAMRLVGKHGYVCDSERKVFDYNAAVALERACAAYKTRTAPRRGGK